MVMRHKKCNVTGQIGFIILILACIIDKAEYEVLFCLMPLKCKTKNAM